MAFATVQSWSETPASNTEIDGVNIDEGCNPSGINNAIRELMAQVAAWTGDDTIASATTTDLSTVNGQFVSITGTTTITGFGTVKAGWVKFLHFAGALTLTHNATSMILPGGNNITVAAGDTAAFVSLGSGNWRCLVPPGYISLSTNQTWTGNQTYDNASATTPSVVIKTGLVPAISTLTGGEQGLQIENGGNGSASAVMAFHRQGSHAVYFGLDTDNKMKIGGWSEGLVAMPMVVLNSTTYNSGTLTNNGAIRSDGGSVGAPALAPDKDDTDTGLYAVSDGTMGVAINGAHIGHWNSTGWTVATTSGATTFGSVNAVKNLISGGGQIDVTNTTGGAAMRLSRASGTDGTVASFHYQTTSVGTISVTASATAYNTSSDERLKPEDSRVPLEAEIDIDAVWAAIEPLAYDMVDHWSMLEVEGRYHGMLAQQLHKVYPHAVTPGEGNPGDEDFLPWSIDYSKLVPLMVARQKQFERRTNERFAELGL